MNIKGKRYWETRTEKIQSNLNFETGPGGPVPDCKEDEG
jgi:hypothetical protein